MRSVVTAAEALGCARVAILLGALGIAAASSPAASADLSQLWEHSTGLNLGQSVVEDRLERPFVYAAIKEGGLVVLDNSGSEPTEVAVLSKSALGGHHAMDLVQKGDQIFLALGDFFGRKSKASVAVVSVENPLEPIVVTQWTSKKKLQGSAAILVHKKRIYLAAMKHGVFVFEQDEQGQLVELSTILPDVDFPRVNPGSIQHPNARGLAARRKRLYVANDAGGLRVISLKNPDQPLEIGRYINSEMGDKQQAYNNLVLDWPLAYVAVDYCGVEVLNVKDPSEIRQVGWWNPWDCDQLTNNWFNSAGHTNQIVIDKKADRLYLSAGDSELQVLDISVPDRLDLEAHAGEPQNGLGAWGVGVSSKAVYLTYIRTFIPFIGTWSGVKAFELP